MERCIGARNVYLWPVFPTAGYLLVRHEKVCSRRGEEKLEPQRL